MDTFANSEYPEENHPASEAQDAAPQEPPKEAEKSVAEAAESSVTEEKSVEQPVEEAVNEEAAELEAAAVEEGLDYRRLMENAGSAAARRIRTLDSLSGRTAVILCGSGNNGGDGWVCARALAQAGWPVTLVAPRAAEALTAEPVHSAALKALAAAQTNQLPLTLLVAPDAEQLEHTLN